MSPKPVYVSLGPSTLPPHVNTPHSLHPIPHAPTLSIHATRDQAGLAAAHHVIGLLKTLLHEQPTVRVIFACAPSQNEFLAALRSPLSSEIPWQRVTAFHMDEYLGLSEAHPASFRNYLKEHFLSHIQPGKFHPIQGEHPASEECARYSALIAQAPIDLICLGIGENGHLAFNDPPVALFDDPHLIKPVELDPVCRQQQVNDGCFPDLASVPTHALTLTLPVFLTARHLSVVVPGPRKAAAVVEACEGPVSTDCPASLLQCRKNATLFLDSASAARLKAKGR